MPRASAMSSPRYDVHPSVAMVQKWVAELPARTGRTLDEWAATVRKLDGTAAEKRAALKAEHGFGGNQASWVVEYAEGSPTWDADPDTYLRAAGTYVDAMYAGGKAHLRPVLDALLVAARELGREVKVCPCKTMVPLYRERVFAEIKPATKSKVTLALAFTPTTPEQGVLRLNHPRLKQGDRLTHVIDLTAPADVTPEVLGWLAAAYEKDGE